MNILCMFGRHKWNGCKCTACRATRDEEHDWSTDCETCATCGAKRYDRHQWIDCICAVCGKTRDEGHDWFTNCERCSRCGKSRQNSHNWIDCQCSQCKQVRPEGHDWSKDCEKCAICGATLEDAHDWSSDCGGWLTHDWIGCACSKCQKTRDVPEETHDWSKDCEICARCGKTRDQPHDWIGCTCSKCQKTRDEPRNEDHDWSEDCEKCARCGKPRRNVHKWNLMAVVPRGSIYVCSLCGKTDDKMQRPENKEQQDVEIAQTDLTEPPKGENADDLFTLTSDALEREKSAGHHLADTMIEGKCGNLPENIRRLLNLGASGERMIAHAAMWLIQAYQNGTSPRQPRQKAAWASYIELQSVVKGIAKSYGQGIVDIHFLRVAGGWIGDDWYSAMRDIWRLTADGWIPPTAVGQTRWHCAYERFEHCIPLGAVSIPALSHVVRSCRLYDRLLHPEAALTLCIIDEVAADEVLSEWQQKAVDPRDQRNLSIVLAYRRRTPAQAKYDTYVVNSMLLNGQLNPELFPWGTGWRPTERSIIPWNVKQAIANDNKKHHVPGYEPADWYYLFLAKVVESAHEGLCKTP